MIEVKTIQGEIFTDHRGQISSLNDFVFEGVDQHEKKWFYCVKGSFTIALVQIDNWEQPSTDLVANIIPLSEKDSKIVCVPEGYANCIKAGEDGSILLVFSGKRVPEAYEDSWRYDKDLWVDWQKY